ncbi:helix-turn-helix domain-containing protein [Nocardia blacklockiae]|uniref:helix-turn-helix domain-containing protein n=1 Tax=Nocardia blacklockiae TaxID=480036 RepID=UPI0018937DC3|nr:helix-turn-helix transcriptional regulator [Nocardia blacklockiae]MBF6176599.1 helix-turn-helix transcriptional regulator [Nocardia blacklockiae]
MTLSETTHIGHVAMSNRSRDVEDCSGNGFRPPARRETRLAQDGVTVHRSAYGPPPRIPQLPVAAWRTDEMRNALHSKDIGAVLRAWRHHEIHGLRPIPQTVLARALGITQGQLSRIENGRNRVRDLDKLSHYARVLGAPAELLWFELGDTAAPAEPAAERLRLPNGALVATSARAPGPVLAESLLSTLDEYVRADRLAGSSPLLPVVTQQERFIDDLEQSGSAAVRSKLRAVHARFAEFLAWLHQDSANLPAAAEWAARAAALAREAGDDHLLSYIRLRQSSVAADVGDAHETLYLAQAALHDTGDLTHRHRAMAQCQFAHGYARLGDVDNCRRALDRATRHAARPAEAADLARHCTPDYVAMEAALCLIDIGHPEQAIDLLEPRLPGWRPENRRDFGRSLAVLALALAAAGEPDRAVEVARHALVVVAETHSARTEIQLYRLVRQLHATGAHDHAAELRIALHGAL